MKVVTHHLLLRFCEDQNTALNRMVEELRELKNVIQQLEEILEVCRSFFFGHSALFGHSDRSAISGRFALFARSAISGRFSLSAHSSISDHWSGSSGRSGTSVMTCNVRRSVRISARLWASGYLWGGKSNFIFCCVSVYDMCNKESIVSY